MFGEFIQDLTKAVWWSIRNSVTPSVLLRRQVPIRFDEEPNSWLGGLPRMPREVDWPRDPRRRPYQFLAQIACADLPARLWRFVGPRHGWLLFFVSLEELSVSVTMENCFHVLHIQHLGPERPVPGDMPSVRHVMSASLEGNLALGDDVAPKLWRRWPVDVVRAPGALFWLRRLWSELRGKKAKGPTLSERVYGAPAKDLTPINTLRKIPKPLTLRGALFLVDALARKMEPAHFQKHTDPLSGAPRNWQPGINGKEPAAPGWLAADIQKIEAKLAEFRATHARHKEELAVARNAPADAQDKRKIDHLRRQVIRYGRTYVRKMQPVLRFLLPYAREGGEEDLAAFFAANHQAHLAWAADQHQRLLIWKSDLMARDLDGALDDATWDKLISDLKGEPTQYWTHGQYAPCFSSVTKHLRDYGLGLPDFAKHENVLDLYTTSAEERGRIPSDLLRTLEPQFRQLCKAPHQLGGYHAQIQDSSIPSGDVLLLQLGSDSCMGWSWGDAGAIYFCISRWDLIRRRFDKVYGWLDGH